MATRIPRNWPAVFARGHFRYFVDLLRRWMSQISANLRGRIVIAGAFTGAIVGRQPFGGFGLSGIGSKAGGADYLLHFVEPRCCTENTMRHGFAPGLE